MISKFVYNGLQVVFGGGLADKVTNWMTTLFDALLALVNNNIMATSMSIFSVLACSFLLLYYYMDMASQASRDMMTLEKFVTGFIKLLVAFTILACAKDLMDSIISFGKAFYEVMASGQLKTALISSASGGLQFNFDGGGAVDTFPEYSAVQTAFEDKFSGFGNFFDNLGTIAMLILPSVFMFIAQLVGYFVCTSNALNLLVRCLFSPLAIVQCFEDGTKSAGIRYLKATLAEAITMGVMVIILYASSALTTSLLSESYDTIGHVLTLDNLDQILTFSELCKLILPDLAAIGAMIGAGKITREIFA